MRFLNVQTPLRVALAASLFLAPLFAGGFYLDAVNPAENPEAKALRALAVARMTACHKPEISVVTATAELVVNGHRETMKIDVIALNETGTYAVKPNARLKGSWILRMVASNPEFGDFRTSLLIPVRNSEVAWNQAVQIRHTPTEAEIAEALVSVTP